MVILDKASERKRKRDPDQNDGQRPPRKQRREKRVEKEQNHNRDAYVGGLEAEVDVSSKNVVSMKADVKVLEEQPRVEEETVSRTNSTTYANGHKSGVTEKKRRVEGAKRTEDKAVTTEKTPAAATEQVSAGELEKQARSTTKAEEFPRTIDRAARKAAKKARQKEKSASSITIASTSQLQRELKDSTGTEVVALGIHQSHSLKPPTHRNKQKPDVANASVPYTARSDVTPQVDLDVSHINKNGHKPITWAMSGPIGGRFLSLEPIFTADEKHIIFATSFAINVYSASTSLLVHSLAVGSSGKISAYTVSASNSDILYVGTEKGHVLKFNIFDTKRLGRWSMGTKIYAMQASAVKVDGEDILYIIDKSKGWGVTAHRFGIGNDPSKTDLAVLVNIDKPLHSLHIVGGGKALIAMTSEGLLMGYATSHLDGELKKTKYDWRELKCNELPSCVAIRLNTVTSATTSAKQSNSAAIPVIDVVVGGVKGCLFVYQDVLNQIGQSPQTLHWHREVVGAVAWSLDGNYIISGGRETVLVLWQLETGRRQFLPNLESPVRSLVVSPTGSSYAVGLGDNSLMVLSTSELTPTTNVVGLQSFASSPTSNATILPQTVDSQTKNSRDMPLNHSACIVSPHNLNHIIVAVPAYQPENESGAEMIASPYIQTFDLANSRHAMRQAITRTNATSTNLSPEGNRIIEPNVTLMHVSSNACWLATVDEWVSPRQDVADLITESGDVRIGVKQSQDIQLKFWLWDAEREEWMLNSRIASPHQKEDSLVSNVILDLAADPSGTRFATLGVDSTLRVWTPKSKTTTGKIVRGERKAGPASATGQVDTWWSLDYSVQLQSAGDLNNLTNVDARHGKLAFSNDGSTLAAYQCTNMKRNLASSIVHFVDTDRGMIHDSRTNLYPSGSKIHDFGFLDRYFICVGHDKALVWDITSFSLHSEITLKTAQPSTEPLSNDDSKSPLTLLAINIPSSTFAVAVSQVVPDVKKSKVNSLTNYHTKISIFSPYTNEMPPWESTIQQSVLALLSSSATTASTEDEDAVVPIFSNQKGYVILDAGAEIRTLQPKIASTHKQSQKKVASIIHSTTTVAPNNNAGILASLQPTSIDSEMRDELETGSTLDWSALLTKQEDDRPVVRAQQLANIFDHPSHAMPSMMDMFTGVLRLYAGKA